MRSEGLPRRPRRQDRSERTEASRSKQLPAGTDHHDRRRSARDRVAASAWQGSPCRRAGSLHLCHPAAVPAEEPIHRGVDPVDLPQGRLDRWLRRGVSGAPRHGSQGVVACFGNPDPVDMKVYCPEGEETFNDDETTEEAPT